ncbi:MAG: hypothetical protein AAGI23_09335 [Bacteroidota bacterium]
MRKLFLMMSLSIATMWGCQRDPCAAILCRNGGVCTNGVCDCPPQFEGGDCNLEKTPVKMRFTSVQLNRFPETTISGAGWDFFDAADIYVAIEKDGKELYTTSFVEDLRRQYTYVEPFEFDDPTATYSIVVYDYDDGLTPDDYMGGIIFTPYIRGERFPRTIELDCDLCRVALTLKGVTYFH